MPINCLCYLHIPCVVSFHHVFNTWGMPSLRLSSETRLEGWKDQARSGVSLSLRPSKRPGLPLHTAQQQQRQQQILAISGWPCTLIIRYFSLQYVFAVRLSSAFSRLWHPNVRMHSPSLLRYGIEQCSELGRVAPQMAAVLP